MKKNDAKIFSITGNDEVMQLEKLNDYLLNGNFVKIIEEITPYKNIYSGNYFFHVLESIAYSQLNKPEKALKILKNAERIFENVYEISYHLAKIYEELNDYDNAIKYYKKSYDETPDEYNDAKSDCFNDLGVVYWNLRRKDEALECWKSALMEDPQNIRAAENIRTFTNTYGEPSSVSPLMDDLIHFQNIQVEKYFKLKQQDMFKTIEEGNYVIDLIKNSWNEIIAPKRDELDSLSPAKKTKWFTSIKINFEKDTVSTPGLKNLSFLPEHGTDIVILGFPALLQAGMTEKRLIRILESGKAKKEEKDVIIWAFELTTIILASLFETNKNKAKKEMSKAKTIASEYLDEKEIEIVFEVIIFGIKESLLNNK